MRGLRLASATNAWHRALGEGIGEGDMWAELFQPDQNNAVQMCERNGQCMIRVN